MWFLARSPHPPKYQLTQPLNFTPSSITCVHDGRAGDHTYERTVKYIYILYIYICVNVYVHIYERSVQYEAGSRGQRFRLRLWLFKVK